MKQHESRVRIRGVDLIFQTGHLARLANGAVFVSYNDTSILATACMTETVPEGVDFFPLRVDYQEKLSAAGIIQGGYKKREGQPTVQETLTARLCDRSVRPMFPWGFLNEVQLIASVYSYDKESQLEPLAVCAVSAALALSSIPLLKTIAAVRVGYIQNQFVINPTIQEQKESSLNLVLAGTKDAILMIEGGANFISEELLLQAIQFGHEAIGPIVDAIDELKQIAGREKITFISHAPTQEMLTEIEEKFGEEICKGFFLYKKHDRDHSVKAVEHRIVEYYQEKLDSGLLSTHTLKDAMNEVKSRILRKEALLHDKRLDGRKMHEVRPIESVVSVLPRTHGSALFTRGETQALCVATLASSAGQQRTESLLGEGADTFYLQYNFPPFSVNECGRMGSPGRREIGHGKLAERAIAAILPSGEKFPYTVKLESNILMSNGSSSMASVCGGCLALIDAGVPIREPISGVAMGLILDGNHCKILSDIIGTEDYLGDMDFKIAGGESGIVSFQMDIKVEGITLQIMKEALEQALHSRLHILSEMKKVIPQEQKNLSKHAPRLVNLKIPQNKIGVVIGPGGKQIRAIQQLGVTIDISDEGLVNISGTDSAAVDQAYKIVSDIVTDVEPGKTYLGEIVSIVAFGLFVSLPGQKEGLLHISEIAHERLNRVEDAGFKEKDMIEVKVLEINDRGQIKLSRKALIPKK